MAEFTPKQLIALVRPMPKAKYEVDNSWSRIEKTLELIQKDYGLNLEPDFQRGHVWTEDQQVRFVEAAIRGAITSAGLLIQFNCPIYAGKNTGDLPDEMQCVDGLQRLTSLRKFIAGDIKPFGLHVDDLEGTEFDPRRYYYKMAVHAFQTKAELLQYYLDLNAGGTPHSAEEIDRVRGLLAEVA